MQKVPCKPHVIHTCIHTPIPTYLLQKCAGYITADVLLGSLLNKLQGISDGCVFVSEEKSKIFDSGIRDFSYSKHICK